MLRKLATIGVGLVALVLSSCQDEAAIDEVQQQVMDELQERHARDSREGGVITPELNGLRVKLPGNPAVYLIDRGVRRHVPDPETYNRLFRSWDGIQEQYFFSIIQVGAPISTDAVLMRGWGTPAVYFVEPGVKRHVSSPAAMDRYHFDWAKIVQVPASFLATIPDGPSMN
jgi:hypothetical protein